jgi:hypothetical protein
VLSNLANFNPGLLAQQVAEIYLEGEIAAAEPAPSPAPTPEPDTVVTVAGTLLDAYAGEYQLVGAPLRIVVTRADDALTAQATGQQQFTLTAQSDSVFLLAEANARFVFAREPAGDVNRFRLTQGGQTIEGRRVGTEPDAAVDLTQYVGVYDSPELETTYTLVLRNDTLVAEHVRHDPITLTQLGTDRFSANAWFFGTANFARDAAGEVTGMRVSSGRVRNLLFVKRTGDTVGR